MFFLEPEARGNFLTMGNHRWKGNIMDSEQQHTLCPCVLFLSFLFFFFFFFTVVCDFCGLRFFRLCLCYHWKLRFIRVLVFYGRIMSGGFRFQNSKKRGIFFFHTTGSIASHADVLWTSSRVRPTRSVWEATGNIAESDTITSEQAIIISVKPREIIASGTRHHLH